MDITLRSPRFKATVAAVPSKSEVHRAMICAALGREDAFIPCPAVNKDIEATARCLNALGARLDYENDGYTVQPIKTVPSSAKCDCGESGTTLRFMIPLCAALGCKTEIKMHGRLPERPLSPLDTMLEERGVSVIKNGDVLTVAGSLPKDLNWSIAGNVSSQFISGMLFALTVAGGKLTVTGKTESKPYIDMTVKVINSCGGNISENSEAYTVKSALPLQCPTPLSVGGDWSGAAFPICIGVTGRRAVTVNGLDTNSTQGDKAVIDVLRAMGANITVEGSSVTAHPSDLHGCTVDCSNIPDLVPVLAVTALKAEGKTEFINAARLRLKESDRLTATKSLITALGGKAEEHADGLTVYHSSLSGGIAESENDHRIAMSAAVAACFADGCVTIKNAQCADKSYPTFWNEFEELI
ncbi:MAG: 3-phosphoshikimate 1-carboxyvinyltransferase [Clostridia bacterium]|nr:3-phosphoshikimate 1-carboxyvinyltransferase [Clostridia bacterium]